MDWQPEHWLLMLGFVSAHAVPAYMIYAWMMAVDRRDKRRAKIRPHIRTILTVR